MTKIPRSTSYSQLGAAFRLALMLATGGTLASCGKKVPEGQVVAVVNGEEVTRRDLVSEPQVAELGEGAAAQAELGAALNGIVDRKLAAAEAKRLELDRTPQYVAQAKRTDEVMLSRALFDRWAAQMPQPGPRAVADYIARNSQRFDGRKLFLVDQIQAGLDKDQSRALVPLQSNDAIASYLDSQSKPYHRNRVVMDSATLTQPLYRRLLKLTPGSPLAIVRDGGLVVLSVIETRDAPLAPAERTAEAIKAIKQDAVRQKLAILRKSAAIAYQPGYRPGEESQDLASKKPASAK